MSNKKENKIKLNVNLVFNKQSIPIVGWHNQYATVTYNGKTYEISIAGGCRAITVSDEGGFWSVSIEELLPQILTAINKTKDKS